MCAQPAPRGSTPVVWAPKQDVERLDMILRSVSLATRRDMREVMRTIWPRFVYARSFLDAETYLPPRRTPSGGLVGGARVLDRQHVLKPPLNALASWLGTRGAPDAFDTLMLELATRLETSRSRAGSRTPGSYM